LLSYFTSKMKFKFIDLFNKTYNSKNKQTSYHLRKKQLKSLGLTAEEIEQMVFPKPKVKFYKK